MSTIDFGNTPVGTPPTDAQKSQIINILNVPKVKTSNYQLISGDIINADTSGSSFELTLPATPSVGDRIEIYDMSETFDVNNLTVGNNGNYIKSNLGNLICDVAGVRVCLIYDGGSSGWMAYVS